MKLRPSIKSLFAIPEEMEIHPFLLSFASPQKEKEFLAHYNQVSLPWTRFTLWMATLFTTAWGALDYSLFHNNQPLTNIILCTRIFLILICIIALTASYHKSLKKNIQLFTTTAVLFSGITVIFLIGFTASKTNSPHNYVYLLKICIYGYTLMRIRFIWAFLSGIFLIILFEIISHSHTGISQQNFLYQNSFLIGLNIMGMLTCYDMELSTRINFFLNKKVELEKDKTKETNLNLENMVEKRTEQLKLEKKRSITNIIQGQELERQRLAKDLHDDLGVRLANLKHSFEIGIINSNKEMLDKAYKKLDLLSESIREISHNMMPNTLERYGLKKTLSRLFKELEEKVPFSIDFDIEEELNVPQSTELHLFRIIQELTNNAVKHSKASKVKFTLLRTKTRLTLSYWDNGTPMNKQCLKDSNGLGLSNIASRLSIHNGSFTLSNTKPKGKKITLKIPLKDD